MRVIILEDDPWVADLLKQMVLSIRPSAQVHWLSTVKGAIEAWQRAPFEVVLAEWDLPNDSAVGFLETIRREDRTTPLVIISGRPDRGSVLSARALGVNAFLSKPFQVLRVLECLKSLMPQSQETAKPRPVEADFKAYLADLTAAELDLPLGNEIREKLLRYLNGEQHDLRELAECWQQDPALCARLIAVANSSSYCCGGRPCLSQFEAMHRLGVQTSLNFAFGMALRHFTEQAPPLLQLIAQEQLAMIERLHDKATTLARQCQLDPAPLQTAALLHRMGELSVLYLAQLWENRGASLDDDLVMEALSEFSSPFAFRLKSHWRLCPPPCAS